MSSFPAPFCVSSPSALTPGCPLDTPNTSEPFILVIRQCQKLQALPSKGIPPDTCIDPPPPLWGTQTRTPLRTPSHALQAAPARGLLRKASSLSLTDSLASIVEEIEGVEISTAASTPSRLSSLGSFYGSFSGSLSSLDSHALAAHPMPPHHSGMSGSTAPALAAVKLGEPTHLSGLSYQLAGGVAHLPTSHEHQPAGSTGLATLPAERSFLFGEVGSSVMMGLAGAGTSGAGQFDSAAASMGLQPVGAHRAIQMQPEPLSATMQRHSAQPTQSAWGPAVPMGLQHAPLDAHPLSQMQSQAPSATILQQVHPAQPSQSAWDPADPIRLQHPPFPEHLHTNSSSAVDRAERAHALRPHLACGGGGGL